MMIADCFFWHFRSSQGRIRLRERCKFPSSSVHDICNFSSFHCIARLPHTVSDDSSSTAALWSRTTSAWATPRGDWQTICWTTTKQPHISREKASSTRSASSNHYRALVCMHSPISAPPTPTPAHTLLPQVQMEWTNAWGAMPSVTCRSCGSIRSASAL